MVDPIIASVLAKASLETSSGAESAAAPTVDATAGDGDPTAERPVAAEGTVAATAEETQNPERDGGATDTNDDADHDEEPEEGDDDGGGDDDDDRRGDGESADDAASDPAQPIIDSFPVSDDEDEQEFEVIEVAAVASHLALPTKTGTTKEDRRLAELRGKGFTDDQLLAVGAVLTSTARRQRKLPVHAAVCSAAMQAYWARRDRERREADCMKAIRNDGGQLGPVRYYESIIKKHDPLTAAKLLAEHHGERITAIRYIVTATFNEGRREDAVAKGVDPTTVKFLQVRTK